ncbi:hypothetical protein JB92DRAFT_2856493 [Gautieria morchelliformis]|nr:hypothetical protein JB92DRAFT_2856493 [Gautieria morchelliformis]
MESPSYRIQRWIGHHFSYPSSMSPKPCDSVEARTRRQHEHFAEVDWELEEFEREMALRFVTRDLQLGLEERRGRNPPSRPQPDSSFDTNTVSRAGPDPRGRSMTRRLRTQSSAATLQQLTLPRPAPSSSQLSPVQSSFPHTPRTSSFSSAAPPTTAELSPRSAPSDALLRLFRPAATHRHSSSVLSLSSHFSSCTSSASASASASADHEVEAPACPNASARSLVSQFGHKLKHGLRPFPASPRSPYRAKIAVPATVMEVPPPGAVAKKRRVVVPGALAPKKRRLIVRGINISDDDAVEGVRKWASGLGEVSRLCRTQDGTIWIEFRDRRVAENVCVLQAQVQIPRVGRVVLDWAEGRHPG